VVLRLRPLVLDASLPLSSAVTLTDAHLRSRVAAAYFADERADLGPRLSAAVLASTLWCRGASQPVGTEVPLAVLGRIGETTVFHDEWTVRRERFDPAAANHFDGRIAARPSAVFSAQLTQFQCHLAAGLSAGLPANSGRKLIDAGIVETPPAGYLPMTPGSDALAVAQSLLGPGVDLRAVVVPFDHVPHEIEAVRHRDRISLLAGLDDPGKKPKIDVLVPDGTKTKLPEVRPWSITAALTSSPGPAPGPPPPPTTLNLLGAAQIRRRGEGVTAAAALLGGVSNQRAAVSFVEDLVTGTVTVPSPSRAPLDLDALRTVAAAAFAHAVAARADLPGARVFAASFDRDEAKPIAIYCTLRADGDPWRSDNVIAGITLDIYTPAGQGAYRSLDLVGRLRPGGLGKVRFLGQATDGQRAVQQVQIDATVSFTSDEVAITVGTSLTVLVNKQADHRGEADVALRLLRGGHLEDPSFYERAREAVFGTGGPRPTPPMTTNHGWIAFRRRGPDLPEPPATTGKVKLWVASAAGADEAAQVEQRLRVGQPPGVQFREVGTGLVFLADSGQLLTAPEVLQAAYQSTGGAEVVRFCGFGPPDMTAGLARVQAVLTALKPLVVTGSVGIDAIPDPPDELMDQNTDGSLLLVAYPRPVFTGTLQVIGSDLTGRPESVARIARESIRGRDTARVESAIGSTASEFGVVTFTGTTVDDEGMHRAIDAVSLAVTGHSIDELTPVLWIDDQWMEAHPDTAKAMLEVAGQIVVNTKGHVSPAGPLSVRDVARLALDTRRRTGLLIYLHQKS
jgi:hypothetical protein